MAAEDFKVFINSYLSLLEELVADESKLGDEIYCAQIRLAERTFNFFLDRFPIEEIRGQFGLERWNEIKRKRDEIADQIANIIESVPEKQKRYEFFCDQLKQPRIIGAML